MWAWQRAFRLVGIATPPQHPPGDTTWPSHPPCAPQKSSACAGIPHSEFLIFPFHKHCFMNTASPQMRTLAGNEWALTADSPRPKGVGWPSHANSIEIHRQTTGLSQWGRTCGMRRTFRKKKNRSVFFLPILSFAEFAPSWCFVQFSLKRMLFTLRI